MRIAIPIHAFEPGGVERVGLRLAERWQAEGHDVVVVLGRDRGTCRKDRPWLDYRTFVEPAPTEGWEAIWMMICLVRFLWRERVDAVFCPGLTYTAACVVAKLILGRRCPPVLVKVSNDLDRPDIGGPLRWPYRAWLWLQGRLLDHFVAIGAPMRDAIARDLSVPVARVTIIPDPALDAGDLADLAEPAEERVGGGRRYLAVGRLMPQKNFALLLEAFAMIAGAEDRLLIAGEGPLRMALEAQARRLGLVDRVTIPGHVHDTVALYRGADALVISSDFEGVPAVVIEALAAGLPIAATDCCASMNWLLEDERFGVMASPGDATALAAAMQRATTMVVPRSAMRRRAASFTLERASSSYCDVLEQLVASHGGGTAKKSAISVRLPGGGGV